MYSFIMTSYGRLTESLFLTESNRVGTLNPCQLQLVLTSFRFENTTIIYTAEDVDLDFVRRFARVYKNVTQFKRSWGGRSLYNMARDPTHPDNEKINDIIDIRLALKIPTKEPMDWMDIGLIRFGFKQTVDIDTAAENRIRIAAHLPPC